MAKFRYWKMTIEEMEKLSHDDSKVLNWDIKCIKEPEEDAVFFGIFLIYGKERSRIFFEHRRRVDRARIFSGFLHFR